MIQYILCLLIGHRFVRRIHSGKTTKYWLGEPYTANLWRWESQPFCIRCGKPNKNHEYEK